MEVNGLKLIIASVAGNQKATMLVPAENHPSTSKPDMPEFTQARDARD